jgi:DNA-binding transcriptional LysR family regulator
MQHLCKNTRVVLGRKNHPLAHAKSLKGLVNSEWATTAIDYNAEEDLARLFASYNLPPPRVMFQARSTMSVLVALAQTDLLAMLPAQWMNNPMTKDLLQALNLKENLPAPSIVLVRRIELPLTPPAEYFCDVLMRNLPVH